MQPFVPGMLVYNTTLPPYLQQDHQLHHGAIYLVTGVHDHSLNVKIVAHCEGLFLENHLHRFDDEMLKRFYSMASMPPSPRQFESIQPGHNYFSAKTYFAPLLGLYYDQFRLSYFTADDSLFTRSDLLNLLDIETELIFCWDSNEFSPAGPKTIL